MTGINKAILVGNMGRDIEVNDTHAGQVGKFSLATSKKVKNNDRTTWHNIVVWDEKKIDYLRTYAKTGTRLYVEGEISNRSYEKDGEKKWISEIVVSRFDSRVQIMANGRTEDDQPAKQNAPAGDSGGSDGGDGGASSSSSGAQHDLDDEVPF